MRGVVPMKFSNKSIKLGGLVAAAIGAVAFTDVAMARDAADVAKGLFDQLGSMADLVTGGMFLGGLGVGGMSALKFKEHNENPQQVKLSKPVTYALVSAALIGLPTYLKTASSTLNGDGDSNNSLNSGVYSRIGS